MMRKTSKTLLSVAATLVLATGFSVKADAASYKVQSGDSLWSIAQKYDTSISSLKSINNLSSNTIFVNQIIETSSSSSSKVYTVKSGDSLYKIATTYGISVSSLMDWNNLTHTNIYPGQQLAVSNTSETQQKVTAYKVSSGDSLYYIGKRYGISVSNLKLWNKLTSNMIYAGQVLRLTPSTTTEPKPETNEVSIADKVISEARKHVGTPYVWGGTKPGGFDCSGFIYYVHKVAGMDISRTNTSGYYNQSYKVSSPVPGDLVFFSNTYKAGISYMGIYIGNNEFIHSSSSGVQITSLDNSYWSKYFTNFRRWN